VLSAERERWEPESLGVLERHVREADLLAAISPYVAATVETSFRRRPVVVEDGVDLGVFRPAEAAPPPPLRVAVVGSFQPRKRYDLVLEAAGRLPDARFWCVGAGPSPLRASVEAEIPRRGLRNVEVVEPMARDALARRLAASHVLFHPSEHEGAPHAVLQAQACGCVPVARSTYDPPTVVDGRSGALAADDAGLLRRLEGLAADPSAVARLREGALAEAARRSWDVVAARWSALLLEAFRP
jgi:glycosyltransferase involved in cell wall biosynthesis